MNAGQYCQYICSSSNNTKRIMKTLEKCKGYVFHQEDLSLNILCMFFTTIINQCVGYLKKSVKERSVLWYHDQRAYLSCRSQV